MKIQAKIYFSNLIYYFRFRNGESYNFAVATIKKDIYVCQFENENQYRFPTTMNIREVNRTIISHKKVLNDYKDSLKLLSKYKFSK